MASPSLQIDYCKGAYRRIDDEYKTVAAVKAPGRRHSAFAWRAWRRRAYHEKYGEFT